MANGVRMRTVALLMAGGSMVAATAAFAQTAPQGGQQPEASATAGAQGQATGQTAAPDIVVVGSQIRGSKIRKKF